MTVFSRLQKHPALTCLVGLALLFLIYFSIRIASKEKTPIDRNTDEELQKDTMSENAAKAIREAGEIEATVISLFRGKLLKNQKLTARRKVGRNILTYEESRSLNQLSNDSFVSGYLWPKYIKGVPQGDRIS